MLTSAEYARRQREWKREAFEHARAAREARARGDEAEAGYYEQLAREANEEARVAGNLRSRARALTGA